MSHYKNIKSLQVAQNENVTIAIDSNDIARLDYSFAEIKMFPFIDSLGLCSKYLSSARSLKNPYFWRCNWPTVLRKNSLTSNFIPSIDHLLMHGNTPADHDQIRSVNIK